MLKSSEVHHHNVYSSSSSLKPETKIFLAKLWRIHCIWGDFRYRCSTGMLIGRTWLMLLCSRHGSLMVALGRSFFSVTKVANTTVLLAKQLTTLKIECCQFSNTSVTHSLSTHPHVTTEIFFYLFFRDKVKRSALLDVLGFRRHSSLVLYLTREGWCYLLVLCRLSKTRVRSGSVI